MAAAAAKHAVMGPPHAVRGARPASLGLTALMASCQLNNELEVKALLQRKPTLTAARDRTGKTALHYCAENLTLGCAQSLLATDPGMVMVQDEEGYTALHFAVISGNRTMVGFLVDRGADVACVDNEKHSCVHWATVCGELECLDILVSAGANPSTPDIHGAYPIHYAAQMCGPNSEVGNDVRVGMEALRRLIALGVDVGVRDQDGRPPLLWAASVETRASKTYCPSGSSDAILALVNAGADVSATDKDGLSALHCAASRGHVDCIETLVTLCGAQVDAVDSNGCSALFYAVTLGHADCTQLLLKYGAMANRQDKKGRTAAHCGAAKGQLETLRILAQHGANLYVRNIRGDLPLHEAVQSGRKDLVQWLLDLQPSTANAPNNNGRTALHVAAVTNNVEICKVLMDRGADVNPVMRSSKGHLLTPLDASLQRGNRGCAKYLRLHGALPFGKMTDKHDIDRWLEQSANMSALPPAKSICPDGIHELPQHGHLHETWVQTDSGYFDERGHGPRTNLQDTTRPHVGHTGACAPQSFATTNKHVLEGGRTLKQAIITNVYVRTSGGRTHQSKRRRGSGDDDNAKEDDSTSGGGESQDESPKKSKVTKVARKHVVIDANGEEVSEEVIVEEGSQHVKRIVRKTAGSDDLVRVSGEVLENPLTTPEGLTSTTMSEQKSLEGGQESSCEEPVAKAGRKLTINRPSDQHHKTAEKHEHESEPSQLIQGKKCPEAPSSKQEALRKRSKIPRRSSSSSGDSTTGGNEKTLKEVTKTHSKTVNRSEEYQEVVTTQTTGCRNLSEADIRTAPPSTPKPQEHEEDETSIVRVAAQKFKQMANLGDETILQDRDIEDTHEKIPNGECVNKEDISANATGGRESSVLGQRREGETCGNVEHAHLSDELPVATDTQAASHGTLKRDGDETAEPPESKMGHSPGPDVECRDASSANGTTTTQLKETTRHSQSKSHLRREKSVESSSSRAEKSVTPSAGDKDLSSLGTDPNQSTKHAGGTETRGRRSAVDAKREDADYRDQSTPEPPCEERPKLIMIDTASSPVFDGVELVDTSCGSPRDTLTGSEFRSVQVEERGCSPAGGEYTADAACATTPGVVESVGCSPVVNHIDASCSPLLETIQELSVAGPIPESTGDVASAAHSPRLTSQADAACSPPSFADMVDNTCSPHAVSESRDQACSAANEILRCDAATSPIEFLKEDLSSQRFPRTPPLVIELADAACSPPEAVPGGKLTTATDHAASSPMHLLVERVDGTCSPAEPFLKDASSSPATRDAGVDAYASPAEPFVKDMSSSPTTKDTGVDASASPAEPFTAELACSPFVRNISAADEGSSPHITSSLYLDAPTALPEQYAKHSPSGAVPEHFTRTPGVDAACSPIEFVNDTLSLRSSSSSLDVEIAVRSSSMEEHEKSPLTDIGAIPSGSRGSPMETPALQEVITESVSVLAKPAIADSGTSPMAVSLKAAETSTETCPISNVSDSATSPICKQMDDNREAKKSATTDTACSPIPAPALLPVDFGKPVLHRRKKILSKSRSWDVIGTVEKIPDNLTLPEITGTRPAKDVLPTQTVDKTSLQKLPAIVRTANTSEEEERREIETKGNRAVHEKTHLTKHRSSSHLEVERDRSPTSSVRSSDHAAGMKDSGFSDVERAPSGSSGDIGDEHLSDSAAQKVDLRRKRLKPKVCHADFDSDGSAAGTKAVPGRKAGTQALGSRHGVHDGMPHEEHYLNEDLTLEVQKHLRKYQLERQLFSELQELKRHQIRSGRSHEQVLVKRLVDKYRDSVLGPGMKDFQGQYTFKNYETYLYGQLRELSSSNEGKVPHKNEKKDVVQTKGTSEGPLECVNKTYKCHHAAQAYRTTTGEVLDLPRKAVLPAMLPSPINSVFAVVRGAPTVPSTRGNYSHVRSRVFPQKPVQRVDLAPQETANVAEKSAATPKKVPLRKLDGISGILNNQASRLRVERLKRIQMEEKAAKEQWHPLRKPGDGSKPSLAQGPKCHAEDARITETSESSTSEESAQQIEESMVAEKGPSSERKATEPSPQPAKTGTTGATRPPKATTKLCQMEKEEDTEPRQTFPYLKKNDGRKSVRKPSPKPPPPKEPDTPNTQRRFSKSTTTPTKSSALLPFWVPHSPTKEVERRDTSIRDNLGEQTVRFKDWIRTRKQEAAGRRGSPSETDSGHEGDKPSTKDVILEEVSRSLQKEEILPSDLITMRLQPSQPPSENTSHDEEEETITRTLRVEEFLDATENDIVVKQTELKPENVSEGDESPDCATRSTASSTSSDSVCQSERTLQFEIKHGREKNVFWLPTNKIRKNRQWQVTFIVAKADSGMK
ncbi:uncharacterized protein LOC135396822 [Ornithodoros turicata]|uniref:uncharacterized protein LOC135396822 n=1 Tax=Ornithodoros turicata TaxID=34597 RepID=UPI00313A4AC5